MVVKTPEQTSPPASVADALTAVNANIADAAAAAGRAAEDVALVAVSKTFPTDAIVPALEAGHRIFGENRVQESAEKWPALKTAYPDARLHLIGPLQTNKVAQAVALFDVIETVDRPKLARFLSREIAETGKSIDCFVQVNTGDEPQKAGISSTQVDDFVRACSEDYGLNISGLMCIPPVGDEPSLHFALLAKLAARNGLTNLSMGMSGDYETAVRFGATSVRVGTAIFGSRPPFKST